MSHASVVFVMCCIPSEPDCHGLTGSHAPDDAPVYRHLSSQTHGTFQFTVQPVPSWILTHFFLSSCVSSTDSARVVCQELSNCSSMLGPEP